jgi:hypothetical protein
MAQRTHIMILASGGLRSLVSIGLTLANHDAVRLTLLHVGDGRDNAVMRRQYVTAQADHFAITRVRQVELGHIFGHGYGRGPSGEPVGTLAAPQMLCAALAEARWQQASRLIWPAAYNAETRAIAQASEQLMLTQHLAEAEATAVPELEAPLLEMSDQQVIELGGQLGVPWHLAWSCLGQADRPCLSCPACRRRRAAFEAAGIVDTAISIQPGQAQVQAGPAR